jgi:hypothetical protein
MFLNTALDFLVIVEGQFYSVLAEIPGVARDSR